MSDNQEDKKNTVPEQEKKDTKKSESQQSSTPKNDQPESPQKKKKGWLRYIRNFFLILILLFVTLLIALWFWSGSNGSLAQAISLAQRFVPIVQESLYVEDVKGSIRHGGSIALIRWQQENITTEVTEFDLSWNLNALLRKEARVNHLTANSVHVNVLPTEKPEEPEEPKEERAPLSPLNDVSIPFITVYLDQLKVNTFIFGEEESAITISDIEANYLFNRTQHEFNLESLVFEQGHYQAHALLTALNPKLDAQLTGVLASIVPGSENHARVNAKININGLLTELNITADAKATVLPAATLTTEKKEEIESDSLPIFGGEQSANLTATVTPWDALILPKADLKLEQFNVGALWPTAPQTSLSGEAHVTSSEKEGSIIGALHVLVDIKNSIAGVIDQNRLPVSDLKIDARWDGEQALLDQLEILIGKGSIAATASVQMPEAGTENALPMAQVELKITDLNPKEIMESLDNDKVNGLLTAGHKTAGIYYDLEVKALDVSPDKTTTLKLRNVSAHGSIVGKEITLQNLTITTSRSTLKGKANYLLPVALLTALTAEKDAEGNPAYDLANVFLQGIATADLKLDAPGIAAQIDAVKLSEKAGSLKVDLKAADLQETLAWVKQMPFIPPIVHDFIVNGGLDLFANVDKGWGDPTVDVKLTSTRLNVLQRAADEEVKKPTIEVVTTQVSDTTEEVQVVQVSQPVTPRSMAAPSKSDVFNELVNLTNTEITLNGRMSNATLMVKTNANVEKQFIDVNLQANGGLKQNIINLNITELTTLLRQIPENGGEAKPVAAIHTTTPVVLNWNNNNQALLVNPGSLELRILGRADRAPVISWDKISWQAGTLDTTGTISSFPALWLTELAGTSFADLNLGGDLTIGGRWSVHMGAKLDFLVEVVRTGGDLILETSTSAFSSADESEHLRAGVKDAYIKAYNKGNEIHLDVLWDTTRASGLHLNVMTILTKTAESWTVLPTAPISGFIKASLPEIGIASAVAPTGWRFNGNANLDATIGGQINDPYLIGNLKANNIALRSVLDGISFTKGSLDISFTQNEVQLKDFTLHGEGADGGTFNATGLFSWPDRKELPEVSMNLVIDQLKASVHRDRQVTTSANIKMTLKEKALDIHGNVLVDRALIIIGGTGAPSLDSDVYVLTGDPAIDNAKEEADKEVRPNPLEEMGIRPTISVVLDVGKNFRVQGFGLQTYLEGDMVLSNQGWTPTLIGTINTVNGRFKAYAQHLIVETGTIVFSGAITNPTLNILAIRANTQERVGINVTGMASHPSIKLYSESGMPDSETLSWLILGRPSSADGTEMAILQQAALALVSGDGEGITEQLAGAIGLDEISVGGSSNSNASSSEDTLANTTVTIGKRLTDDFYVTYEQGLTGAMGTFYVFYDISRRLTLRGEAGEFTAVDLIYSFRFDGAKR